MNHYGLDPAWYFSAPGVAWDATLKITKIQLDLSKCQTRRTGDSPFNGGFRFKQVSNPPD